MRKAIIGLLLAATAASPLAAQDWQNRDERRQNQQELRQDRRELRQDRQDLRREFRQGDAAGARDARRELRQDQRDFVADRREAFRDNQAVRNGTANNWAERQRDWRADRRDDRRDDRDDWRGRRDGRNDGWRGEPSWGNNWRRDDRWNYGWRNDRRYDWQDWRNRNRDLFRGPRFYAPRGYSYRRWVPGYRVDPFFYGQRYWIMDPYAYRLPPAWGNYRWVRYYDDAMLVDIRTGLIADILYSFFW